MQFSLLYLLLPSSSLSTIMFPMRLFLEYVFCNEDASASASLNSLSPNCFNSRSFLIKVGGVEDYKMVGNITNSERLTSEAPELSAALMDRQDSSKHTVTCLSNRNFPPKPQIKTVIVNDAVSACAQLPSNEPTGNDRGQWTLQNEFGSWATFHFWQLFWPVSFFQEYLSLRIGCRLHL